MISAGLLLAGAASPAFSQSLVNLTHSGVGVPATVTVNAGASLGTIPPAAFGLNMAVWDGNMRDPGIPSLLTKAGVTALRFPGGDNYPYDSFDAFMGIANKIGATPIITVNCGSNADGTGGGDPNEAAAWVDYSNNTKKYGVKYWEIGNEVYGNGEYGAKWEEDLHTAHDP